MRYTRQRDRVSCGPVAIINMLKWIGYPVSHDELMPFIRKHAKCKTGTESNDLSRTLRHLGNMYNFDVKRIRSSIGIDLASRKKQELLSVLSCGGCSFIFNNSFYDYKLRCWRGHYFFVPSVVFLKKYDSYYMNTVNLYKGKTLLIEPFKHYSENYATSNIFIIRPR